MSARGFYEGEEPGDALENAANVLSFLEDVCEAMGYPSEPTLTHKGLTGLYTIISMTEGAVRGALARMLAGADINTGEREGRPGPAGERS